MSRLAPAAVVALAVAGCATGGALRQRADALDSVLKKARDQGALTCAPRELATAEANQRFARLELEQGHPARAGEHLDVAESSAHAAVEGSKDCGKVAAPPVAKPPPPPPPAPKIALKDADGDGVPDLDDLCPEVAGPKENRGCPVVADKDGDGITDDVDRCPDQAGPKENFGCPWPDKDGDGTLDADDACPDVPGPKDNRGCPRPQKLVIVRRDRLDLRQQVHFRAARAVILPKSYELLREVAKAIEDAPGISVRIEGHTDSRGSRRTNLRLSQERADAVKAFLVRQGVDPRRLLAEGYGSSRPIASNATAAGRAANRRVEFRIVSPAGGSP